MRFPTTKASTKRHAGSYKRFGYKTSKAPRGRRIEIADDEAKTVRTIHTMYDAGIGVMDIRQHLITNALEQKGYQQRKHEWNSTIIYDILQAEDYTGVATWNFGDGKSTSIETPTIVDLELWERNQQRLERNKRLSIRNAKGIYLLQGLVFCGDCNRAMRTVSSRFYYRSGERRLRGTPAYQYQCPAPNAF